MTSRSEMSPPRDAGSERIYEMHRFARNVGEFFGIHPGL